MRPQDYIALLWELKGNGVLDTEDTIYGCINPECSSVLKNGLITKQVLMIVFMCLLAFLHAFAIGVASESLKPHIHFKSLLLNTIVFLLLIGVITGGVLLTARSDFDQIMVNPESIWRAADNYDLPSLGKEYNNLISNESEWYPLTEDFKIIENCDGIPDTNECQMLNYLVKIEATTGLL